MRYAIVSNSLVTNVVIWDGKAEWSPPKGSQLIPAEDATSPGDTWDGTRFTKPLLAPLPPVVPSSISDRQFFQALAIQGVITNSEALAAVKTGDLPAALKNLLSTLDPTQRFSAEMLLSGATVFNRGHPLTDALAKAMSWTNTQLDTLWIDAAQL